MPEIDAAVAAAVAGDVPLETGISRLLFSRDPRDDDPRWPPAADHVFNIAIDRFIAVQGRRPRGRAARPTIAEAWFAIERLTLPHGRDWWDLRKSWPVLAMALGLKGDRAVAYQLHTRQGWRFSGRSRRRRITHAPCIVCGAPTGRELIRDRCCPACTPL